MRRRGSRRNADVAVTADPTGVEEEESDDEDNGEGNDDEEERSAADFDVSVVKDCVVPLQWL